MQNLVQYLKPLTPMRRMQDSGVTLKLSLDPVTTPDPSRDSDCGGRPWDISVHYSYGGVDQKVGTPIRLSMQWCHWINSLQVCGSWPKISNMSEIFWNAQLVRMVNGGRCLPTHLLLLLLLLLLLGLSPLP